MVFLAQVNLGTCCGSQPKVGLLPWFAAGGVGIDTAFIYGDQQDIAKGLATSGKKRSDYFITTKITSGTSSDPKHCQPDPMISYSELKVCLQQLNVSYVDMVLLHRPCQQSGAPKGTIKDPDASNNALWSGLERAMKEGLTRAIGVSNYDGTQLGALKGTVPALNQCEMSLKSHDDATILYSQQHNITYEAYGTMRGCEFTNPAITKIAKAHSVSTAQVCSRWVLQRGAIMAAGTGSDASKAPEYSKEDLDIFGFALTAAEMDELNKIK